MNIRQIIACLLTLLLAVYSFFALSLSAKMDADDRFKGYKINIHNSGNTAFVSETEVSMECNGLLEQIRSFKHSEMRVGDIEELLRNCDKIETANVSLLNNGIVRVDVTPMAPVARVFNGSSSYYINSQGKKISADPRYHIDVPVVVGDFNEQYPPQRLLPMLHYIASEPSLNALVSTLRQDAKGNIFIIPTIRGHVVNFGDTTRVAQKFEHLCAFYRKIMPVRGWETYDTIAVKWKDRIVATRRDKALKQSNLFAETEEFSDVADLGTMSTESTDNGNTSVSDTEKSNTPS